MNKFLMLTILFILSTISLAIDKVEIVNTKPVVTSQVEVHARVVPIFNVKQTKSLEFNQVLSNVTVEKDQIITITDEYNAPIQFIFPAEAEIKTETDEKMTIQLNSPEEMAKFINANGSRDIIVRGTITSENAKEGTYKGNATFQIKYD